MAKSNLQRDLDEVLAETFNLVQTLGSSARAAKELGISRPAVDQRLRKGSQRGLFEWHGHRQRMTRERLSEIIKNAASISEAATMASVAPATLRSLAERFGLTGQLQEVKTRYRRLNVEERRAELYREYDALRSELGREPTVYDLQRDDRALYSGILYHYKSIEHFRAAFQIPKPRPHRRKEVRPRPPRIAPAHRRNYVIVNYHELVEKLGHDPSTSEMVDPAEPERTRLYRLILKEWGTFRKFRRYLKMSRHHAGVGARYSPNGLSVGTGTHRPKPTVLLIKERPIDVNAVRKPSRSSGALSDPEGRRKALDRRTQAHQQLLVDIIRRLPAGYVVSQTRYIDAVVRDVSSNKPVIVEVKSLEADDFDQTARAIGQLFLYRLLHRDMYDSPELVAAFPRKPTYKGIDLTECLNKIRIGAVWRTKTGFGGTQLGRQQMPWLFGAGGDLATTP